MGESVPRRSTLVSRLPIFRRSSSKRQESLPSSPSSGGVGNGVHSASPSSTNSSSSSTGKRRSLFRAPSLSFKRSSEPRPQPLLGNPALEGTVPETDANGNQAQQQASTGSQDGVRTKTRHSFGFGGHRNKKITRSQTEDFDKASSGSSSNRNNVFINCISSGTNEGDDSGFLDDYSASKRSSKKKQLLPKSFSAHQRFSRNAEPCRPPEVSVDPPTLGSTPGSWAGELLGAGSSLQSPILSEDRTTAVTPSEFIPITEDSVSEVDALPTPSPGLTPGLTPSLTPGLNPGLSPRPASPPPPVDTISHVVSSSQVFFTPAQSAAEKAPVPDAANTDYETAVSLSEPDTETTVPPPPPQQTQEEREERAEERREARVDVEEESGGGRGEQVVDGARGEQGETSESDGGGATRSGECHSNPEQSDRRHRNILSVQEAGRGGICCGRHEPRSSHLRKPHTASMCSSVSPYHEVMRMERRLRSSSEGAGGPRLHLSLREPHYSEAGAPLKHRTSSSSSKLGSLDVLNNLGSSELDEDDLMLDLDLSDDMRQRHVSREDSSQSLASCLNLLPSPMDTSGDKVPGRDSSRDTNHRELCRPSSLLPADWSLGLGREEEPLVPGLEALPLRLMQQDCTSVKTLLLRLKRTLAGETSPASSLHSLPISPCSEKSLPFKDLGREEALLQQLRDKDQLIHRLQAELECAKAALKPPCLKADRTTQTEALAPEIIHPNRLPGQSSSTRDRKTARFLGVDQSNQAVQYQPVQYQPVQYQSHQSSRGPPDRSTARQDCHSLIPAPASTLQPTSTPASVQPSSRGPASSWVRASAPDQTTGLAVSRPLAPSLGPHPTSASPSPPPLSTGRDPPSSSSCRRPEGPPSQIPRALGGSGGGSSTSLQSPCLSLSSDSERAPPAPRHPSSSFAGRLGQPPRGPLSLHMYSRKNIFLQHSLHSADITALAQHDS